MFNGQFEYYCCGTSFINLSMMNTIIISIFLLAAISILPNDAHNWISSEYVSYRNNAKSFISEKEDFIRELGSKYNLNEILIAQKIEKLSSLRRQVLENFERCNTSWEPDFGEGSYISRPLNENQLEQCLRRVENPFHQAVDSEIEKAGFLHGYVSLVSNVDGFISQSDDFMRNLKSKYNFEEEDVALKIEELFLLKGEVLPNNGRSYDGWVRNVHGFISENEDFIRNLSSRCNLNEKDIVPEMNSLTFLKEQVLKNLEVCVKSWDPEYSNGRLLNYHLVEHCWQRVEDSFHKAVDTVKKKAEFIFHFLSWGKNVKGFISQSEDFIKDLRSKYNLEEKDMAPKIEELSFKKRQVLQGLEKCLEFYVPKYIEGYSNIEKELEQCWHRVDDSFRKAVEIIKAKAEFSFNYYGWVKIVHGIISELNDFIKNLSRNYNPDENEMAPKLEELDFLERQVREDLEGCFKLLVPDNVRGNTSGINYELDQCFQRVGDSFEEAVKIVTEEAVFSSNSNCAFLHDDMWETDTVISCADPLIRNATNQRIVDCMYLRVTNSVINSFEEYGLVRIVPKEINNCHRNRFSELSRKLVYLKTMLFRLRASSFDKLNNITSRNNKCSPGDIVKLDGFHPLATKLCSQFYNYIRSENKEYEECSNNKKD